MNQDLRPLSNHEAELLQEPSIASQLPYTLNDKVRLTSLACLCNGCQKRLDGDSIAGRLNVFQRVVEIDAVAGCEDCRSGTPLRMRYYEDGKVMYISNGHWRPLPPPQQSLGQRLIAFGHRFLGRI